ncbi:MAG: ATP-binding response regulator [Candidatus Methylomirabilia bacterium]
MGTTGLRILLVEDDSAVRGILAEVLRYYGYELQEASDGRQAIELFSHQPAQIVITDVRMPGMDGLEVLARIKKIVPETCVVIMTGYGGEDTAIQAIRNGASNYFKKPVNIPEFVYAVGVLADLVRSRREHHFDPRMLERESRTVRIGNDIDAIYPVIRELTANAAVFRFDIEATRIALLEALTNAIEHGSLGISLEEKRAALRDGTLRELFALRAASTAGRKRTVCVEYELTPARVCCRVTDEGEGFDWRALPDYANPDNLLAGCGRGIVVMRLSMDEVVFSDRGNEVTLIKRPRAGGATLAGACGPPAETKP